MQLKFLHDQNNAETHVLK